MIIPVEHIFHVLDTLIQASRQILLELDKPCAIPGGYSLADGVAGAADEGVAGRVGAWWCTGGNRCRSGAVENAVRGVRSDQHAASAEVECFEGKNNPRWFRRPGSTPRRRTSTTALSNKRFSKSLIFRIISKHNTGNHPHGY